VGDAVGGTYGESRVGGREGWLVFLRAKKTAAYEIVLAVTQPMSCCRICHLSRRGGLSVHSKRLSRSLEDFLSSIPDHLTMNESNLTTCLSISCASRAKWNLPARTTRSAASPASTRSSSPRHRVCARFAAWSVSCSRRLNPADAASHRHSVPMSHRQRTCNTLDPVCVSWLVRLCRDCRICAAAGGRARHTLCVHLCYGVFASGKLPPSTRVLSLIAFPSGHSVLTRPFDCLPMPYVLFRQVLCICQSFSFSTARRHEHAACQPLYPS